MNFCPDVDGAVLLGSAAASGLVCAIDGAVVAFEADEVDAATGSGWSVVVTGSAAVITDPAEHRRLARAGPRSWVPSPSDVRIRIEPELLTGRELLGGSGPDLSF